MAAIRNIKTWLSASSSTLTPFSSTNQRQQSSSSNHKMATTQGITFIGIGNMGLAAVLALRKANLPVTIWNRTTTSPKVQSAIAAGATLEPSLSSALSANPLIIICVLDYPTITSLFTPLPPSLFANKTIINLTNGTPRQSTAMQSLLQERQISSYFDGAIMVTPQMVALHTACSSSQAKTKPPSHPLHTPSPPSASQNTSVPTSHPHPASISPRYRPCTACSPAA
jgi:hypothetical protein